ncbi:MAG: desulfoferrodoxin [Candidatus Cloacimonetes bacterium]|nr:desulfoferrodoxin [Candidatus Cloacimonadota bacterium]
MTKLRDIYYCEICGNVVEIFNEGQPALVCCGQPMNLLEEKTADAGTEKHVPYIEETADGVLVKVGKNTPHPMLENHYIKFIELHKVDKICRFELKPGDAPERFYGVPKADIVKVRAWCNLHGLWKG